MAKKVEQEQFERFVQEVSQVITIMGADVMKMQSMMYNLLDELGKVEKPVCVACKEVLIIPVIKGIEKSDICPACGENIYGSGQTTFESWDDEGVSVGGEEE
ncbi:MAG: hypothetical protein CMF55_00715 [Legionellales bacterium]|nr:hypothetical protein [Legionellales bacterium]|tara:strand:- start:23 stop:328 length:306 start_codon:yes stop_codon:yes gene_type:complete